MNLAFRSIWNQSLGAWVAAPEQARRRGRRGSAAASGAAAAALAAAAIGVVGVAHGQVTLQPCALTGAADQTTCAPAGGTVRGMVVYNTNTTADLNAGAVYWDGNRWIGLTPYFSVNSTAAGNASNDGAHGQNSMAAGVAAKASGVGAVAVGHAADARTSGSIAVGSTAVAGQGNDYRDSTRLTINQQSALMGYGLSFDDEQALWAYVAAVQTKKDANKPVRQDEEFVYRSVVGHMNNIAQGVGAIAEGSRVISIGEYAGGVTTRVNRDGTQDREVGDNWNLQNVNIGTNAGTNSARDTSVAIGHQAGYLEPGKAAIAAQQKVPWPSRHASTYVGAAAGKNTAAYGNIGIGANAGANIIDTYNNGGVFIGSQAGIGSSSQVTEMWVDPASGVAYALRADGSNANPGSPIIPGANTAIGPQAFRSAKGSGNVAVGRYAMQHAEGGANTVVGENAGLMMKGDANVVVGTSAGWRVQSSKSVSVGNFARAAGTSSIAIGNSAHSGQGGQATAALNDIAIGTQSKASGGASVALGKRTDASAESAVAIGSNAQASGVGAIAVGGATGVTTALDPNTPQGGGLGDNTDTNLPVGTRQAVASGAHSMAIGTASVASAEHAIAIGKGAQASGVQSISIGTGNVVLADHAGAIGDPNHLGATATGTYILGNNNGTLAAPISTPDSFLVGSNIQAGQTLAHSINLGTGSTAYASGTQTAGLAAYPSATIGGQTFNFAGSTAPVGVVTVGQLGAERRIQNVSAGLINSTSTDAVNGSQLYALLGAGGGGWNLQENGGTQAPIPVNGIVNAVDGVNTTAVVIPSADGARLQVNVVDSPNFAGTVTTNGLTINPGSTIDMGGNQVTNVAAGTQLTDAVNVSQLNQLSAKGLNFTDATGTNVVHKDLGGTLPIVGATTQAPTVTALSKAAPVAGTYSSGNLQTYADATTGQVQIQMADSPKFGNVTINEGDSGKITGVMAGTAPTDAVNVSQLQATNSYIDQVDNRVTQVAIVANRGWDLSTNGGPATNIKPGGRVNIDQGSNVVVTQQGGNLTIGVVDNPTFAGPVITNGGLSVSRYLTVQPGTIINFSGNVINGVAPGVQPTDAVNVQQLQELDNRSVQYAHNPDGSVNYNSVPLRGDEYDPGTGQGGTTISNVAQGRNPSDAVNVQQLNNVAGELRGRIDDVDRNASAGTAAAMATAGIPQAYLPGKSLVGAALGGYRGQSAIALGVSAISDNGQWIVKGTLSHNSRGHTGVTVGAGYQW